MESLWTAGYDIMIYIEMIFPAQVVPLNHLISGQYQNNSDISKNLMKYFDGMHQNWNPG